MNALKVDFWENIKLLVAQTSNILHPTPCIIEIHYLSWAFFIRPIKGTSIRISNCCFTTLCSHMADSLHNRTEWVKWKQKQTHTMTTFDTWQHSCGNGERAIKTEEKTASYTCQRYTDYRMCVFAIIYCVRVGIKHIRQCEAPEQWNASIELFFLTFFFDNL